MDVLLYLASTGDSNPVNLTIVPRLLPPGLINIAPLVPLSTFSIVLFPELPTLPKTISVHLRYGPCGSVILPFHLTSHLTLSRTQGPEPHGGKVRVEGLGGEDLGRGREGSVLRLHTGKFSARPVTPVFQTKARVS